MLPPDPATGSVSHRMRSPLLKHLPSALPSIGLTPYTDKSKQPLCPNFPSHTGLRGRLKGEHCKGAFKATRPCLECIHVLMERLVHRSKETADAHFQMPMAFAFVLPCLSGPLVTQQ